jgi:hypothetical protein
MARLYSTDESSTVSEITALWSHIFGDERGLLQVWTGKRVNGEIPERTVVSSNFKYPEIAHEAAEWALKKSEEGREVYFCAHLLDRHRPRRIKENAAPVLTLWGDLDGVPVPNGELKPTAVVHSSPEKYHAYWRLDSNVPPEIAEDLNKRIAQEIGADPSGFDLTQLLRVPGTVNHKYEDRPRVEVVEISDDLHSPRELHELLPEIEEPDIEEPETGPGLEEDEEEPPIVLSPEALKVWRGEKPKYREDNGKLDKSATLMKIGRALFDAGGNELVVVEGVRERDKALGYNKFSGNRDGGQKEYERIWKKLEKEGRNDRANFNITSASTRPEEQAKHMWPEMDKVAYRGIFGRIVEAVSPHTEGDDVAVLTGGLVAVGNALGRGPYMQIGATKHRTNLFIAHVGETAKGRKGSAWNPIKDIMHVADKHWAENRILNGLSSGEGLISEVRDPASVPDKDGNMKVTDQGVEDKRLLIMEGELSQGLKVMKREGNTLSPVMRNAWDGETLRTMVKHSPHRATDPHISVAGHITHSELIRHLTETEMANGLANRFQWFLVRRSKSLPFGGEWHTVNLAPITRTLVGILEFANRPFRMEWGADARELWCEAYEMLTEDRPGMFGAITARAEAQTLRLAMLYALADHSDEIHRKHVESALAVWEYAESSALYIFGDATGDPDADKVLAALKDAVDGMTRTEISELFGRNKSSRDLERIREVLQRAGRIHVSMVSESGSKKPVERWHLT